MKSVTDAQDTVLSTAKELLRRGLVEGTSGNISARLPDGNIVCTPSSVDYAAMVRDDLVVVSAGRRSALGQGRAQPDFRTPATPRLLPCVR